MWNGMVKWNSRVKVISRVYPLVLKILLPNLELKNFRCCAFV